MMSTSSAHGDFQIRSGPGTQLEQRNSEVRQLRGERRTVDEAVEELRMMLMQSVAERTRLAGARAACGARGALTYPLALLRTPASFLAPACRCETSTQHEQVAPMTCGGGVPDEGIEVADSMTCNQPRRCYTSASSVKTSPMGGTGINAFASQGRRRPWRSGWRGRRGRPRTQLRRRRRHAANAKTCAAASRTPRQHVIGHLRCCRCILESEAYSDSGQHHRAGLNRVALKSARQYL